MYAREVTHEDGQYLLRILDESSGRVIYSKLCPSQYIADVETWSWVRNIPAKKPTKTTYNYEEMY